LTRNLTLASAALALGGTALGGLLWSERWAALAIDAVINLCG
jgi:hypothetical protein